MPVPSFCESSRQGSGLGKAAQPGARGSSRIIGGRRGVVELARAPREETPAAFIEAGAHLLAVTPTFHWIECLDLAAPILAEPLRAVDGAITAPSRPGLGISWDEVAVRRYAAA
jgi:mandelate racemase